MGGARHCISKLAETLKHQVQQVLRTGFARRKPRRASDQRTRRFVDPMTMISDHPVCMHAGDASRKLRTTTPIRDPPPNRNR